MSTPVGTPNLRHICLISGGKDSTALAIHLRDTQPELELEYVFCDTHKELPETYAFLDRLEGYLGKEVTRLLSDQGDRGFDYWLKMYRGYLPSPRMRWCTRMLKIEPFERYVGDDPVNLYVAIRADEDGRKGFTPTKPNIHPIYPFISAGLKKADVQAILERSGVGMPEYYEWRTRSGCYFCFYQQRKEWVGLKERHPDLFELAKEYEKPDQGFTWSERESLDELEQPERMRQIIEDDAKRRERARARRRPGTLAELFAPEAVEVDGENEGCLMCHK